MQIEPFCQQRALRALASLVDLGGSHGILEGADSPRRKVYRCREGVVSLRTLEVVNSLERREQTINLIPRDPDLRQSVGERAAIDACLEQFDVGSRGQVRHPEELGRL